jgi:hypothetical protein
VLCFSGVAGSEVDLHVERCSFRELKTGDREKERRGENVERLFVFGVLALTAAFAVVVLC